MTTTFKSNFINKEREMVSLSVYNVGLQKCEPGYQWGPGVRDHFLIHFIVSGKGFYHTNETAYSLSAGDCFLVYPYTEVTYYADMTEPWEYYWVGFSGTDAGTILLSTDFTKENPVLRFSENETLKRLLLNIYDARGNTLENQVEMTGQLYTALAFFIRSSTHTTQRNDSYDDYVKKSLEYITSHYSYPITIEEIAGYAGISRSHLFRAFRAHLGISPKEYLSTYRIQQACVLLRHSDLSITSISRSVGYENNLYFSKAFHKMKGCSPTEYAARHDTKNQK